MNDCGTMLAAHPQRHGTILFVRAPASSGDAVCGRDRAVPRARWLLVPADYGLVGPYRASALTQNQSKPIVYAGQAACIDCHSDVEDARRENAHAAIGCESCHGALAAHAADPVVAVRRPDPRTTCAICHIPDAAKPVGFKTVNFAEHAGEEPCASCHLPHAPRP